MGDGDRLEERPRWVKLGLWGVPTRAEAWVFFWLSIAFATGCVAYGFEDSRFFIGGSFVFASLWYYASIRWVDRFGRWQ